MDTLAVVLFVAQQAPAPTGAAADPALELFLLVQVALPALWGFIIPFVVEFVTKSAAPVALRTFLVGVLSLFAGVVNTIALTGLDGASFVDYFSAVLAALLVAGRTYQAGLPDPLARATPNIGIGPSPTRRT